MEAPRKRALVGECISRASVDAAAGASAAELEAALEACDYERAATIAFAHAKAGTPLPTEVIARILPGIELAPVTCSLIAIAPDRAALLDVVAARRFPPTKDAAELEAITLYAAWKAGADRARIIAPLRRLAARSLAAEGYALLATIAASYDDPNVTEATKPIAAFAKDYAKNVATDDKAMTASLKEVLAELPAEVEQPSTAGFTVRAAKQVGRNDPCPCGSGLKFKKCCADKPQAAASPIPGLGWDEFLGSAADRMTREHVDDLALKDLVRVDLTRIDPALFEPVLARFIVAREWAHAARVMAAADPRLDDTARDDLRDYYVENLLDVGMLDVARTQVGKLSSELQKRRMLELTIPEGPERAYAALVEAVREAVTVKDKIPSIELAYALLRAEPVLGILAARACIGTMYVDDAELLLELVEEARDQLNLPPTDPAWDVLDALRMGSGKARGKAAAVRGEPDAELKAQLAESAARVDQLERNLAAMRSELDAARTRPVAELMRAPQAATGLEAKVRELEALIREGNAERRDLRKQLEAREEESRPEPAARSERPDRDAVRSRRAAVDETDDDVGDALELGNRDVAIPRFERRFTDALGDVPATVAAEAMRTVGSLAAGDGFAWRGVKQAKDMVRPVLMARVGIHHRLIFRVEDGAMELLDLITREQLLTTLKRIRAKG